MDKGINILFFLLSAFLNVLGQTDTTLTNKTLDDFKNAGEQQDYWAIQLFQDQYQKCLYNKFEGQFYQVNENTFKFDEKVIQVNNTSEELKLIFKKGIFYPNIITGNRIADIKSKQDLDSLTDNERIFYNLTRIDSLRITDLEEVKFLSISPTYRRFRFALWNKADSKPTACFFELTNNSATENTTFSEFLDNARVTFYKRAWRI